MEHSRCSMQAGWNIKYKKGGKSLCTLYPMQGYFIVLVVVGSHELTEAELLKSNDRNFEGAWKLYARDFDPTLNQNFMTCDVAPKFDVLYEFPAKGKEENKTADISTADTKEVWLETKGIFFDELKDTLICDNTVDTNKLVKPSSYNFKSENTRRTSFLYNALYKRKLFSTRTIPPSGFAI